MIKFFKNSFELNDMLVGNICTFEANKIQLLKHVPAGGHRVWRDIFGHPRVAANNRVIPDRAPLMDRDPTANKTMAPYLDVLAQQHAFNVD